MPGHGASSRRLGGSCEDHTLRMTETFIEHIDESTTVRRAPIA